MTVETKTSFQTLLLALALAATSSVGCLVEESCIQTRDCPEPKLCNADGECVYECKDDSDCGPDFYCENHECHLLCAEGSLECPTGMTSVCSAYCVDIYEASRPDATSSSAGTDESMATSRPGVIPWHTAYVAQPEDAISGALATAACQAAGKRLCTPQEWEAACAGTDEQVYVYGDEYDPVICNSIDGWCDPECGIYQWCYNDCDHDEQVMPTGAYQGCISSFGLLDMSGNVWEVVQSSDSGDHFRGGAFDCGDPALAHRCDYDGIGAGTFPNARGFRCCSDGNAP
jgi:hypothetical protein